MATIAHRLAPTVRASLGGDVLHAIAAVAGVVAITVVYHVGLHQKINATTVAMSYLLLVLFVAASSRLWVAVVTSVASMLAVNFFFLPPVGTFTIADPQNWVALFAFLGVSLVASRLSAAARDRAAIATERAQLIEKQKQAELSQRSAELKSALLSSLAHDLRTPLTAIRVAAGNLDSAWLGESQRGEQADIILSEAGRLQRLFQNILEMTRIDAGAIAPEHQWVHPLEIIEAAQGQVEYALRHHLVHVEGTPDESVVRLDPRLTSAALAHLLENAAQYSPPGSEIWIRRYVSDEGLRISVEDQGPGISAVDLPRLFERFYRGGEARTYSSGTGMGLSITRGLLAAENGRVWAENGPKRGAVFSLIVPAEIRVKTAVQE
jgi:K+-sensing histidine kinase KdpD